jgi:hypothetical protein
MLERGEGLVGSPDALAVLLPGKGRGLRKDSFLADSLP